MDGDVSDSRGLYGLAKNGMNVMKDGNQGTYWFAVGKQLQWGLAASTNTQDYKQTVTLPINFNNSNYVAFATMFVSSSQYGGAMPMIYSKSNSQIGIQKINKYNAATTNIGIFWLAVGQA